MLTATQILEKRRRLESALAETERFITRESKRDPALRPPDVQKNLTFYCTHRHYLLGKIAALTSN